MAGNNEIRAAPGGSRRALLDRLKRAGPQQARDLAAHLGVTAMAARQHLYALEAEGIVEADRQPRPRRSFPTAMRS